MDKEEVRKLIVEATKSLAEHACTPLSIYELG